MASTYLTFTPSTTTNNKVWTWSGWIKRSTTSTSGDLFMGHASADAGTDNGTRITLLSGNAFRFFNDLNGQATEANLTSTALFRDPSAWYHFVVAVDTTQSTASNRVKMYVNGEQITDFSTSTYPSQNDITRMSSTNTMAIGRRDHFNDAYFDGYMAEVHFVDGQQLQASDFGQTDSTGIWKSKGYSGTYGTNGFYLKFSNGGDLGADSSGNANNFTKSGNGRQMTDTPSNVFAIINTNDPLNIGGANAAQTISKAGRQITGTANEGRSMGSTIHITPNGISKAYCEWYGLSGNTGNPAQDLFYSNNINGYIANDDVPANNIVMMAVDCVAGKYWFGNNGVWDGSGDPANGTNPTGTFTANSEVQWGHRCYDSGRTQVVNFGQDSSFAGNKTAQNNADSNGFGDFYYTPPSGFLSLCTENLATEAAPTINDGGNYTNTVLWTGNDGTQSVTGVGFQPDLFWTKVRSVADAHRLADSTRGGSNTVRPNTNGAAYGVNTITFDSDGFTTSGNEGYEFNSTGQTYVSWSWLANGGTTSSNTDGDITSTIQLNQTSGFSIGQYTGNGSNNQTVGTGLNGRLDWVMVKCTSAASTDWAVGTSLISSSNRYLSLNQSWESRTVGPNAGEIQNGGVQILDSYTNGLFNCTSGGASLGSVNANSQTFMFYAFRAIEGYSKFGTYTGNLSTDGPFIYTGFKPSFIIIKRRNGTGSWVVQDKLRPAYNQGGNYVYANSSNGEASDLPTDFLSNGFKLRQGSYTDTNGNGDAYIYAAWAEHPFVTSGGLPVTAR